jgi:iron complex transport system permease protein
LPSITYWLLGSLTSVDNADVLSVLQASIVGLIPLMLLRWRINLLSLGEEDARSLGVRTRLLRPILVASAS